MTKPPELAGPWSLLILALLGVVVFVPPVWDAQFLNFDDNLFFGDGEATVFGQVWAEGDYGAILDPRRTIANAYLPVSHLSLYVDYVAWRVLGGDAATARLHSLLLHVLAAFVLARLLGRLGLRRGAATAVAAVFLVHPALVESVSWVSSRKDVLSGLFSFLCLGAVARNAQAPRGATVAWSALWAMLALYSKGTAVVLLLLAPVVTLLARRGEDGAAEGARRWAPALAVGAAVLLAGLHHAAMAAIEGTMTAGATGDRLVQVPGAFAHYLLTIVWPAGLNVLYPEVNTLQRFGDGLVPAVAVLAVAAAVVVWARRRRPLLAAGVVMVMLALVPFNTAWPASSIAAADRYLYLVVPWAALALVGAVRSQRAGAWIAAALVVPLGWAASERVRDFGSSRALWESSLAQEPANAVARINLAIAIQAEDAGRARDLVEPRPVAKRLFRPCRPPHAQPHALRHRLLRCGQRRAFVETHDDVTAQQPLDLHRAFRRQLMLGTIDMGFEGDALFRELAQPREAHHLEPAAIGQDRPLPVHELVQPAQPVHPLRPRTQHQVIGVAQQDIRPGLAHRLGQHRLDGRRRAHRHEGGRADLAARRGNHPGTRGTICCFKLKLEFFTHANGPYSLLPLHNPSYHIL